MYDHITYTQFVAIALKAIAHTTASPKHHIIGGVGSMDELLQKISKADNGYHLLASDNIDGAIGYANDSPTDRQMNQFCIVKRVPVANYAARAAAKRDCKAVAAKVVGRMIYDSFIANTTNVDNYGLKNLGLLSFSYQSIGPLADGFYGTEVTFDVYNNVDLQYQAADWDDSVIS